MMVVVAPHTPCQGHGLILFGAAQHRRGCLTRCPIVQGVRFDTFRVSDHRFMGCPIPECGRFESFRVSDHCFIGFPIPQCGRFESFRVSDHRFMGCSILQCRRFQSFGVSDHRFMGCPIPQCVVVSSGSVCKSKCVIRYTMVTCDCVSRDTLQAAFSMHPMDKKTYAWILASQFLHLQALLVYKDFLVFRQMLVTGPKVANSAGTGPYWETRNFCFLVRCLPQVPPVHPLLALGHLCEGGVTRLSMKKGGGVPLCAHPSLA